MKRNYIIATPFIKGKNVFENGEVLETLKIDAIYNEIIDAEIYDHLFYIKDVEELIDYDALEDACILIYDMAKIFFDNYTKDIDTIKLGFYQNDKIVFSVYVIYNALNDNYEFEIYSYYDEFDIYGYDEENCENDLGKNELECDGDCDNCKLQEEDTKDIKKNIINTFYFGFDW